jgi:far upstream element-binding protein
MAEDALARARAIAAKLAGGIGGGTPGGAANGAGGTSVLGKRAFEQAAGSVAAGLGSIQKKKIYIPTKEHPDINFLGLLIGPRGATQKQLSESTGAKILVKGRGAQKDGVPPSGDPEDEDELHVSISGTDDAIERATVEVQKILHNPKEALKLKQEQLANLAAMNGTAPPPDISIYGNAPVEEGGGYTIELRVPNHMVGLVIGKGGENIQRMQVQSGAHMQIAKESEMLPGETTRSITIRGAPEACAVLKAKVEETINSKNPTMPQQQVSTTTSGTRELEHPVVIKVAVPNDKVGIVIGKGGITIKSIQERTRAQVQIPQAADEDNPAARTLSIGAYNMEDAEACQMEIYNVLQQHQQQAQAALNAAGGASVHITVPDDKVGLIIGKGGSTIKDIQARTRCKIQIPSSADPGSMPPVRTVQIIGPADCQSSARYEIEMVLQGAGPAKPPVPQQQTQYGAAAGMGMYGGGMYGQQMGMQGMYGMGGGMGSGMGAMGMQGMNAYGTSTGYGYDMSAASATYGAYGQQQVPAPTPAPVSAPQTASATADAGGASGTAAAGTDPTAYYNDFWAYASYYGEAMARQYYGQWSPPVGTAPPAGVTVANGTAPSSAAAATTGSGEASSEEKVIEATTSAATSNGGNGSASTAVSVDASGSASAEEPMDEAARQASIEAYKKQYAEWYEAYGKAAGADPNPPMQG